MTSENEQLSRPKIAVIVAVVIALSLAAIAWVESTKGPGFLRNPKKPPTARSKP